MYKTFLIFTTNFTIYFFLSNSISVFLKEVPRYLLTIVYTIVKSKILAFPVQRKTNYRIKSLF